MLNKLAWVMLASHRRPCGFRQGRIVKVARRGTIISSITVRLYSGTGPKKHAGYCGKRVKLTPPEWSRSCCGLVYRGRLVPIESPQRRIE